MHDKDKAPAEDNGERTALINALRRSNGNQTRADRLLGVNRVTVWNRMRKCGIASRKRFKHHSG